MGSTQHEHWFSPRIFLITFDISQGMIARRLVGGLLLVAAVVAWALDAGWEAAVLAAARGAYGGEGYERVRAWMSFMRENAALSELEKLRAVNAFFASIPNQSDQSRWGRDDYWANPLELLGGNGGDCEDFVIAKYFTLRQLGMADDKLRFAYVKAYLRGTGEIQPHMVLAYYATPDAEPRLLDNLTPGIATATHRPDLTPTYSFPANRLWAARQRQRAGQISIGQSVDMLRDLAEQMARRVE